MGQLRAVINRILTSPEEISNCFKQMQLIKTGINDGNNLNL